MKLRENSTNQKLRGIYYTPYQLAKAMVDIFSNDNNIKTVFEPSFGDGVFIDALYNSELFSNLEKIVAIEIQEDEVKKVNLNYESNNIIFAKHGDFFEYYKDFYNVDKFDLIVGNPPYIRYQYLTPEQRNIQSKILTSHGMKSNKLINAWVGFVVACVQMLTENGKMMLVLPSELLQVSYAEDLREYLSNHFSAITLITFSELVFPDIEQEVLVFIGEKGNIERGIRIYELDNLNMLDNIDFNANGFQKMLHVKEKWTKYFTSIDEIMLIQKFRLDNRFTTFGDIGVINVGITTGNNSFFSVNYETVVKYKLYDIALPLIGRSSHAHGINFTQQDWEINVNKGARAFLLSFDDKDILEFPQSFRDYIKHGEDNNQNSGYKCSIRDKWYVVPSIWVPDAFFLRRNNLYPKFVLNECNAVSTDTMHRIKFKDDVDQKLIQLSYYNSISFAFTEIGGRSYGGGVLEILPSELSKVILPIIVGLPEKDKEDLLNFIDKTIRDKDDIEKVLDVIDHKVLVDLIGISKLECNKFRKIWKKLQSRRLGRM